MKNSKLIFLSIICLSVSIAGSEDNAVATPVPGITEKNGVVFYYKLPIFDLNSDDAHAAVVRDGLSEQEYSDLVLKNGGAACSDEKLRKALVEMWNKEHPTTLTTCEKAMGATLFVTVLGCVVAYQYLYPSKEDKDSTEK